MNAAPRTLREALVRAGVGSRRDVAASLAAAQVTVDGRVAGVQDLYVSNAKVAVRGRAIDVHSAPAHTTLLLHKPLGIVSTCHDPQRRRTVLDLVPREFRQGLHPVGRLDVYSRGALLMTTDGQLTQTLSHPRFQVPRKYRVRIPGHVSDGALTSWRSGRASEGHAPARVSVIERSNAQTLLEVVMLEGRNRQIRNTVHTLGLSVEDIFRTGALARKPGHQQFMVIIVVAYGPVQLGGLRAGHWRILPHAEIVAAVAALVDRGDQDWGHEATGT